VNCGRKVNYSGQTDAIALYDSAKGWRLSSNDSWQLQQLLNFCVALIRQWEVAVFNTEFFLFFDGRIDGQPMSDGKMPTVEEICAVGCLGQGVRSWRDLSEEAEACMSGWENDSEKVPLGAFGPVSGIFSLDSLKEAVKSIVRRVAPRSEAITPDNAIGTSSGGDDSKRLQSIYVNPEYFVTNELFRKFAATRTFFGRQSKAPSSRSLRVIDRTLNELEGLMLLSKITFPVVGG
jgi:hypothetical protein